MNDTEKRLMEWGRELFYPGWDMPQTTGGVLGRLMEEGNDDRVKRRRGRSKVLALQQRLSRRKTGVDRVVPCKETGGVHMEIVALDGDSVACPPDGGMGLMYGLMVERMAKSLERRDRCKEVSDLLAMMPSDGRAVVRVTYQEVAGPNEVGREGGEAARMLGISERTYWSRKKAMLEWLGERLAATAQQRRAA